jgi:pyruvate formate lyase activating enzyme
MNIWIELTTLIVPTYNDEEEQIRDIARFIADVDRGIPWHVSAFYPRYKLNHTAPTSVAVLQKARELGNEAGLHYVYTGNVFDADDGTTHCPHCSAPVVKRSGFNVLSMDLDNGQCRRCKQPVAGIWK